MVCTGIQPPMYPEHAFPIELVGRAIPGHAELSATRKYLEAISDAEAIR